LAQQRLVNLQSEEEAQRQKFDALQADLLSIDEALSKRKRLLILKLFLNIFFKEIFKKRIRSSLILKPPLKEKLLDWHISTNRKLVLWAEYVNFDESMKSKSKQKNVLQVQTNF
jgi:hypothetical protein